MTFTDFNFISDVRGSPPSIEVVGNSTGQVSNELVVPNGSQNLVWDSLGSPQTSITLESTGAGGFGSLSFSPGSRTGFTGLGTAPVIPLPSSLPLFATGIGGLDLLGWRRKRKSRSVV